MSYQMIWLFFFFAWNFIISGSATGAANCHRNHHTLRANQPAPTQYNRARFYCRKCTEGQTNKRHFAVRPQINWIFECKGINRQVHKMHANVIAIFRNWNSILSLPSIPKMYAESRLLICKNVADLVGARQGILPCVSLFWLRYSVHADEMHELHLKRHTGILFGCE